MKSRELKTKCLPDMVPAFVKKLAFANAPRLATALSSSRARRRSQRYVKQWGLFDLNQRLIRDAGDFVLSGPFKGLRLPKSAQREHIGPFLLGTYEMELGEWLAHLLRQRFAQIIDVGAKFGYYAVGLARHFPETPVVAFDTDWWARRAVRETAAVNNARNITIRSFCSPQWLDRHLKANALIVSDCEGAEAHLFEGVWTPLLDTATLLIELHEDFVPGVTQTIHERFRNTHIIQQIASRQQTSLEGPLWSFTVAELQRLAQEVRGAQAWVLLTPKRLEPPPVK